MNNRFCGLIILDGFGLNPCKCGNAIEEEGVPYIKKLLNKYSNTALGASGLDVGLPEGQMGNSEVGHLNMGAGRIVYQELTKITKSIKDGDFFKNEAFLKAIDSAKLNNKKLHIMGLLGDGGVHSHIEHLFALLKMAKDNGLNNAYVHCFTDGRDVPPTSAIEFVRQLEKYMAEIKFGKIATISGRFYPMDRDNRWDRVEKGYNMLTLGEGLKFESASEAVERSYKNQLTDEFILPSVVVENGVPVATVEKGDSIIFYNYRPDRAREITRAFTFAEFDKFERKTGFLNPCYVSMTQYDVTFDNLSVAFKPQSLNNTLGEYLSKNGIRQLRIAETEKYAHVTFFFNGGVEAANPLEERVLISSPKVATYDLKPEMSAGEVADKAVELVESGTFDAMVLNFANCDMVGHTGFLDATVKAVKAVEDGLEKVVNAILKVGGMAIVTADHGNADKMREDDGSPFTAHTTNPVPLIIVDDKKSYGKLLDGGRLCDIAPTMLEMMKLPIPSEMTGHSLIKK
ncbi:MAG: 2,3-bisphosphoglycerate-independent phosphoglycerate mutase [Clostridia bacterium]